jgi:hypothetical protein
LKGSLQKKKKHTLFCGISTSTDCFAGVLKTAGYKNPINYLQEFLETTCITGLNYGGFIQEV